MGGIWIITLSDGTLQCIFWSYEFPPEIITLLKEGIISINNLEMAGVLVGWLVLEHLLQSLSFVAAGIQCDNSSSISWSIKFTAPSLLAGHLLGALALHQQICKAAPLLIVPIDGKSNIMEDIVSRYSSDLSLKNSSPTLFHYFNTKFPQKNLWEEFHLPPKLGSCHDEQCCNFRCTLKPFLLKVQNCLPSNDPSLLLPPQHCQVWLSFLPLCHLS